MERLSSDRSGVLIVRLWMEGNHERQLRARIIQTLDTMTGEESVTVAASAESIFAAVKRWVEDFAGPGSSDGNGHVRPGREDE